MSQWVEGQVELLEPGGAGVVFRGTSQRGNTILLGAAPADGGEWTGVSPMEVVLLALGGCTGIDVVSTLRKMRQHVTGYAVRVRGERRDAHPRIYTRLVVEHVLRGQTLREPAVRRAIELSAGRYCSVSAMLEQSARLEIVYRLIDEQGGAEVTGTIPLPVDLPSISRR